MKVIPDTRRLNSISTVLFDNVLFRVLCLQFLHFVSVSTTYLFPL